MTSVRDSVDTVQIAVASISTCTPATVAALSVLLLPNSADSDNSNSAVLKVGLKGVSKVSATLNATATKGAKTKKSSRDGSNGAKRTSQLSPKERGILATEVINSTLKALGFPAKTTVRIRPSSQDLMRESTRRALRRSNSSPQSPPEPRALHRSSRSPSIKHSSRSSSSASSTHTGTRAAADCARIAFSCLRVLQSSETSCMSDLPPFQVENGMSALIGKLIILGLDDLALKELRILKRRIEPCQKPINTKSAQRVVTTAAPQAEVAKLASLADILRFEITPNGQCLNLAIAVQIHALRLLTSSKKPALITASLPSLLHDFVCSPTQLILQAANVTSISIAKAAKHLDTLSQIFFSLCPSVSSSEDEMAIISEINASPKIVLQLQVLAFQSRILWWNLAGHSGNVEKDILDPFAKCLTGFARRSQCCRKEAYALSLGVWQTIQEAISSYNKTSNKAVGSSAAKVYKILGTLAQEAGCYEDAVSWIEKVESFDDNSTPYTKRCSVAASLLAMKLMTAPRDSKVEELLLKIIEGISGPLKGSSNDLDELLSEVSHARRAVILFLSKRRGEPSNSVTDSVPDSVRQMCESLVLHCPRFTLRFLGPVPDSNAAAKLIIRYQQRRLFVAKSAFNTIDSALFLLKTFQSESRSSWDIMDSTLQDCLTLLEALGNDDEMSDSVESSKDAAVSYFVRISNLYYAQHLIMRRDAIMTKDIQHLRPLRRSIECVRNRPVTEKGAAFLLSKLERIADFYRSVDRLSEAREFLIILREELVETGTLSRVAAHANKEPIRAAWDVDDDTSMLGRAIAIIIKLDMKLNYTEKEMPFYETIWSTEEKGAILERCLDVFSKPSKEVLIMQRNVLKQLLLLYEPKEFPIRRIRTIIRILRFDPNERQHLIDDARSTLALAGMETLVMVSKDAGLRLFLPHLEALASTTLELEEHHPRVDLLKPHLATWCLTLQSATTYEELSRQVDDVPDLVNHLHSIADFLQMKGFCSIRVAVLKMLATINEIPRPDFSPDDLILNYSTLALQYLELGYSGKAGLALDRAQSLTSQNGVSQEAILRVHLSYSEYLVAIGNLNKCEEILFRAQHIACRIFGQTGPAPNRPTNSDRASRKQLVADAHLVYSLLSLARGAPKIALSHAKKNLRLNRFAWSNLATETKSGDMTHEGYQIDRQTDDVSNVSVSTMISQRSLEINQHLGPSLWASLNPLFRSLMHLSKIYAHHGMFRETMYYAVQAYQLVMTTNSVPYITSALVAKGVTWLNAGSLDKASELLMKAKETNLSSGEKKVSILLNLNLGKLHGLLGGQDAEQASYEDAHASLRALTDARYIENIDRIVDPGVVLEEEMSRLTIKQKKATTSRKATTTKKSQAKKEAPIPLPRTDPPMSAIGECFQLDSLRALLLRQRATGFMLWRRCDEALTVLEEAQSYSHSQSEVIDQHIGLASQLLVQANDRMTADPVYSTLQDSTISLPAIVVSTKPAIFSSERNSGARLSPPRKPASSLSTRERSSTKSPSFVRFDHLLREAHDRLLEAHASATQVSSTSVNHRLSLLLHAVTILLSVIGQSNIKSLAHPGFAACSLGKEIARNICIERERTTVLDDVEISSTRHNELSWPVVPIFDRIRPVNNSISETIQFQKDFIDVIPPEWSAISMYLSDSQNELCVTKMQAGRSPFVLRLPLGRNNSRDVDEQVFDFKQGKTELHEIIAAANYTSHSARNLRGREAKVAWWKEREELDVRLKDLLENIENVWLGGFKGIFSQHKNFPDLLARFQKSLQLILDKHLPSRQNMGRKNRTPQITLDPRIWELFIGLGDVTTEESDFDEPLTDLWYFVVDTLQFYGERNALDEIDFDSIVIETLDALRSYNEAVFSSSTSSRESSHTILILDKALHAFPWESLPCMDGLAVSRLPSLSCLRERIMRQQRIVNNKYRAGHYVDRASGSYVLNPGGDLKSTQTAFENTLQSLTEWNSIVKREPSEQEFKENLESKDILLYFGHGSGAQYIRSKCIRRLEKCAVTMLMGCSSGALNEAGDFEPYGPALDYMLAGCPAVVATLWDVTDQDIDRFAKSTFETWGLFSAEPAKNGHGKKGKVKKKMEQPTFVAESDCKVSLVAAVAKSRKACNFQYLTAAAVCVYGIPVYIK